MKKLSLQGLAITTFVFIMMAGVSKIADLHLLSDFDAMSQAFKEFQITDIVMSKLRPDPLVDQRIVLVNLARSRGLIAQQITKISQHKPKVIGIDAFFRCEGGLYDTINCPQLLDTLGNLLLSNAIEEAGNVVLVTKLLQTKKLLSEQGDTDVYDSIEYSDPKFRIYAKNAFASLPTDATYQDDVKQCRSLFPSMMVKDKRELAFSVQIAMLYDSVKTSNFLARGNEEEIINFRGNVELIDNRLGVLQIKELSSTGYPVMFYAVDWDQLLNDEYFKDIFTGSIVLMGGMGDFFGDPSWEDKFFTPLNKKPAGRANPDMFGLVVHANIIAMILNEDYVDELPEWAKVVIAIVVCFLTIILFIIIDRRLPMWFDTLSVTIQIVQILFIAGIMVFAFAVSSFKLDLGLSLAASALVGPAYDIYKGFENQIKAWLTKEPTEVLNE
jgi:CHASE2 domain-containing sensor protein